LTKLFHVSQEIAHRPYQNHKHVSRVIDVTSTAVIVSAIYHPIVNPSYTNDHTL